MLPSDKIHDFHKTLRIAELTLQRLQTNSQLNKTTLISLLPHPLLQLFLTQVLDYFLEPFDAELCTGTLEYIKAELPRGGF